MLEDLADDESMLVSFATARQHAIDYLNNVEQFLYCPMSQLQASELTAKQDTIVCYIKKLQDCKQDAVDVLQQT